MAAKFVLPSIQDNPTGWGPNTIPPKYRDMPYQPFSKSDRLGKVRKVHRRGFVGASQLLFLQISDWTGNTFQDRRYMNKYNSQFGAGGTQYAYYHEEDESSFQLVDTARSFRPMYGRGRFFRGRGNFRGRWNNQNNSRNSGQQQLQVLSKAQKNKER